MSHGGLPSAVQYGCLEDGLTVCLALVAKDRERFEHSAVAWHARWCTALPSIGFAESSAVLSALEALMGPNPGEAARLIREISRDHGLHEVANVVEAWADREQQPAPGAPATAPLGSSRSG